MFLSVPIGTSTPGFSGDRDAAAFHPMLKLAVATLLRYHLPAVRFDRFDGVANLISVLYQTD
jgi:hypothetical protein